MYIAIYYKGSEIYEAARGHDVDGLEAGKMAKHNDLSDYDKGCT